MRGPGAVAATCMCALTVGACGGEARQDANEKEGTYRLEVVEASFPAQQSIADATTLSISVRNADTKPAPNVAVTLETRPGRTGGAAQAFSSNVQNTEASDPSRPIWIVDKGPAGGDTAYTNTWALGRLPAGASRRFEWKVTAVKPGSYTVGYAVSPGLTGRAKPAGNGARGEFAVTIDEKPPHARVGDDGEIIRERPQPAE